MEKNCSNCKFSSDELQCRRYAPRPIMASVSDDDSPQNSLPPIALWPLVEFDDWCGEWQLEELPLPDFNKILEEVNKKNALPNMPNGLPKL